VIIKTSEFVYLEGSFDLIVEHMQKCKDYFMNPTMLKSQFDSLEPYDAIAVLIANPAKVSWQNIIDHLSK
jgi:gluconokinase